MFPQLEMYILKNAHLETLIKIGLISKLGEKYRPIVQTSQQTLSKIPGNHLDRFIGNQN